MQPNSFVLDTQLLLLLIVGTASPAYIARHRRLQDYSETDFAMLVTLITSTPEIVVTPNTLTETSNLARYIAEPARTHICELLRVVGKAVIECYRESALAVEREEFIRLGLADAVLLDLADQSHTLVTADGELYFAAVSQGLNALYFSR
jgi:predicted nucleic acid-binding protein